VTTFKRLLGRLTVLVLVPTIVVSVAGTAAFGASSARRSAKAPTFTAPSKWHGIHASNYKINCIVCKTFGPQAIAKDNGIRATDPVTVALLYARKAYRPPFRPAVFEGCSQGFLLRSRPLFRHAAVRTQAAG
jgi:hypothetical protein